MIRAEGLTKRFGEVTAARDISFTAVNGRITGLPRHDYSITPDMHGYHAFLKIDPQTPGAIIEMGFLAADRDMLVNRPDTLAAGVVAGLLCFLER